MPTIPPAFRPAGYRTPVVRKREADHRRGSSAKRGYDGDWRRLRIEFLALHPYCECDAHQGKDERALSQVVDHIASIMERPDLRLEWSNLRAMTKACHDRHTVRTQGFAQRGQHPQGETIAAPRGRGRTL